MGKEGLAFGIVTGLILTAFCTAGCGSKQKREEVIRVACHTNFGGSSAAYAALDNHFFEREGLKVELLEFSSGPPAIAALEAGDVDISFLGHGAFTYVLEGKVQVIAVDSLSNAEEIMATKESGIKKPEDLIGKTIATQFGTSGENFLKAALVSYGIPEDEVTILNMDTAGAAMALMKGKVDAVSIWAPYTNEVRKALGNNAVTVVDCMDFRDTLALPMSWVASESYIDSHKDTVEKFVRALYAGMDYRNENLEQMAKLVAGRLGMEVELIEPDIKTAVWFDSHSVLSYIEDGTIARWYKELEKFMNRDAEKAEEHRIQEYLRLEILYPALSGKKDGG